MVIPVTAGRRLLLSELFQLSESLAEECEAVGEARLGLETSRAEPVGGRAEPGSARSFGELVQ